MPLLHQDKSPEELKIQEDWFAVRRIIKERFNKRPDINAILFLIGMNEVGIVKETFEKEEKQDLMHVAICRLFENEGYYQYTHTDADGWPHFEILKPLPNIHLKEQENWLKSKIVEYFRSGGYI
jgi:hypothetical protein